LFDDLQNLARIGKPGAENEHWWKSENNPDNPVAYEKILAESKQNPDKKENGDSKLLYQ
jgi:hypothetical protein